MIYKFDHFEINHRLREIFCHGEQLNVEPKVYELIIYFIENHHQAISKEQLQDAIWPSLEVSETAVTRAIMKARKALTDESNPKTYIHTIHGHGYKFIADVEIISEEDAEIKNTAEQSNNQSKTPKIMLLLLLISLIAVAVIYLSELNVQPENHQLLVLPVDNQVEDEKLAWVSLGLMSLASKVIESNSEVWVLSDSDGLKGQEMLGAFSWPLNEHQINTLKDHFTAEYVVASSLSQAADSQYQLAFEVHHPNGIFSDNVIKGDNPTKMVEQMASQVAQLLPGKKTKLNYTVISEDSFTNELYSRGMSFHLQGYVDKAQNYLELAIEQDDSLLLPKYELAVIKRKQNKLQESKEDLEKLLVDFDSYKNAPTDKIKLLNSLGVTYLRLLDYDKAMENYLAAYELAQQFKDYRSVVKTTNNIAIIERRRNNLAEARKWTTEALSTIDEHQMPNKSSVLYLLGQIEIDSGNLDKALSLFNIGYQGYLEDNRLKEAAAVLSATGGLLRKKGLFEQAHEKVDEALKLKAKINDKLGTVDSRLYQIEISIDEENYIKARNFLDELKDFVEQNDITTRKDHIIKTACLLDFSEENYQQVVNTIDTDGAGIKSRNLDMLKLKSLQQLGDEDVLKNWLSEHQHYKSGDDNMMRMYWLDFENYYLESHGSIEALLASYQQRIQLSRLMGNDALTARLLLKTGYQHLRAAQPELAQNTLHELRSLQLDWWQFDLFEAMLLNAKNMDTATELANAAKNKASTAWLTKHEMALLAISNEMDYSPPTAHVFF